MANGIFGAERFERWWEPDAPVARPGVTATRAARARQAQTDPKTACEASGKFVWIEGRGCVHRAAPRPATMGATPAGTTGPGPVAACGEGEVLNDKGECVSLRERLGTPEQFRERWGQERARRMQPVRTGGGGGGAPEPRVTAPATQAEAAPAVTEEVPSPETARTTAADYFAAALPTFDPMEGLPGAYQPVSMADVLADQRYVEAERANTEAMRRVAAAGGLRGSALISGIGRGQQNLLTGLRGELERENRAAYGLDLQRAGQLHQRRVGEWQRAYDPARTALDYGLRESGMRHGQWLGEEDLGLRTRAQKWQEYWAPEQMARQQRFSAGQAAAGRAHADRARDWDLFGRLVSGGGYQPAPMPRFS